MPPPAMSALDTVGCSIYPPHSIEYEYVHLADDQSSRRSKATSRYSGPRIVDPVVVAIHLPIQVPIRVQLVVAHGEAGHIGWCAGASHLRVHVLSLHGNGPFASLM